jgi:hypothetical protein
MSNPPLVMMLRSLAQGLREIKSADAQTSGARGIIGA